MGRFFYHLSKGAAESGSLLFTIVVVLLAVAYFVYKNWDSITSSKLISESTIDINNPKFTKRDQELLSNTRYNYMELVRNGVINDINDIKHRLDSTLMYKEIKTITNPELQQFYDCYREIALIFEELLIVLSNAKRNRDADKMTEVYKEANECTKIIKKRVEAFTDYKLDYH